MSIFENFCDDDKKQEEFSAIDVLICAMRGKKSTDNLWLIYIVYWIEWEKKKKVLKSMRKREFSGFLSADEQFKLINWKL